MQNHLSFAALISATLFSFACSDSGGSSGQTHTTNGPANMTDPTAGAAGGLNQMAAAGAAGSAGSNAGAAGETMMDGPLDFIPPDPDPWPTNEASVSGIYPHLTMHNTGQAECGTGAVVEWADRLWVVTYAPHAPNGSTDKLYEIDGSLNQTVRPESIGGTPANRMIHRESDQLIIGPYFIDSDRTVRPIPYNQMPGRPTATARHLFDPENKVYTMTMEEGLYEVDVNSLDVTELYPDSNGGQGGQYLPGYHGKGGYSAQGLLIYSNNGEQGASGTPLSRDPAGSLGAWDGNEWTVVERAQYTEVTGPGGIYGNDSADDPLWTIGWDFRSLKLRVLDGGQWYEYRLPKASNTYDGRHGWHTEWPRIRSIDDLIGPDQWLMTMHGMFWKFPKSFRQGSAAGIRPLSSYLKIIGDFEAMNGWVIFGADDTAGSTFQEGNNPLVPQSHSNLWFLPPAQLTEQGPREGTGGVWLTDPVQADEPSLPFLFAGYDRRMVHLAHDAPETVTFTFEVDANGDGQWEELESVDVPPQGYACHRFDAATEGEWIRVRVDKACTATAFFDYSSAQQRALEPSAAFDSLGQASYGIVAPAAMTTDGGPLRFVASGASGEIGYYELDVDLNLESQNKPAQYDELKSLGTITSRGYEVDAASVLVIDGGRRWRLPKGDASLDDFMHRGRREVVTERQLFNANGSFYELPYNISGGISKIRPVATHNLPIYDFASWRGLLVLTGTTLDAAQEDPHHVVSSDGRAALWLGAIDDLWQLGKPRGHGGPWNNSAVTANEPSDPYLFYGYDERTLTLNHDSAQSVQFTLEVDVTGEGDWHTYGTLDVAAGESLEHVFEPGYSARWIRLSANRSVSATAQFVYE